MLVEGIAPKPPNTQKNPPQCQCIVGDFPAAAHPADAYWSKGSLTRLLLFFFLDLALFIAENPVHIGLDREQFAHLVSHPAVVGIGGFLLGQQLCIFLLQALDGGQFFQP